MNKKAQSSLIIIVIILLIVVGFFLISLNRNKCGDGKCQLRERLSNSCSKDCSSCTPNCNGKVCGSNGCGGLCGTCSDGKVCSNGNCISSGGSSGDNYPEVSPTDVSLEGRRFIFSKQASTSKVPVIIVVHGRTQSADIWFDYSKHQGTFTQLALSEGYAIIAPDSVEPKCSGEKHWNYTSGDTGDIDFFVNILDWIDERSDLDSDRIYVAGISSGGFMTSRLSLDSRTNSRINAVSVNEAGDADYSSISAENDCKTQLDESLPSNIPSSHPPAIIIHATKDKLAPIIMGKNYHIALDNSGITNSFIEITDCSPRLLNAMCHDWFTDHNQDIINFFNSH